MCHKDRSTTHYCIAWERASLPDSLGIPKLFTPTVYSMKGLLCA